MNDTLGGIRVLHVDDQPEFVELTETFLEREEDQFDVLTATSASAGLEVLERETVDCVVSDYEMPRQNGIELLEAVRADHPDLPFILFTGKGSEEIASEAISAGVTDYLQKSGATEQFTVLANRIRNAVESYRSGRRLAERNLELRKYERMVNTMQEAACIYDTDGRFEIVNEYLADWYGQTPEALESEFSNLIPLLQQRDEGDPFQTLLDGEREQVSGELEAEFPGHGHAVLEYRLTPLRVDGKIEGVVGVTRDITDRRRQQERLERLVSNLPGIVYRCRIEPEWPFEIVSGTCEEITGYSAEALERGEVLWGEEILHPADREPIWEEIQAALDREQSFEVTYRIQTADGATKWMWERGELVETPSGMEDVLEGFITDVTAQREREQVLTTLQDVGHDLDESETIDEICRRTIEAAETILEFDLSVISIEQDGLLELRASSAEVPPDGATSMSVDEGIAGKTYRTGTSMLIEEMADHEEADPQGPYRSGISVAIGEHGNFQAVAEEPAAFDESDLELAELLVAQTESALDRLLSERELERQNERLQEFASVVSHDLRNPLTVARTRLELASEDCDTPHHEAIARSHERMETLIDDLLTLARGSETALDTAAVDLATIARECWQTVATGEAVLVTETDQTIRADEQRLRRLFENLFRNSVEHGGADVTVSVGPLPDGFYVADDGNGIPPDRRSQVFEAGYSTGEEGSGFGLRIVEQIVDAHDWNVRLTSGADGGVRFEVTGVTESP